MDAGSWVERAVPSLMALPDATPPLVPILASSSMMAGGSPALVAPHRLTVRYISISYVVPAEALSILSVECISLHSFVCAFSS